MRFFFYGTLLDGSDNSVAASVHRLLRPLGAARAEGTLHAVPNPEGWYPALTGGGNAIRGALYEATDGFGPADLARLDAYEDYDPARPGESLYIRATLEVVAADGTACEVQAYRFNQPLPPGSLPIPGGDFRAWLAEHGARAFGGLRQA